VVPLSAGWIETSKTVDQGAAGTWLFGPVTGNPSRDGPTGAIEAL